MPIVSGGVSGGGITVVSAEVLTSESTSSASFTDLATVGPSVTVTVGSSGVVLVGYNCQLGTATFEAVSVVLSGANTLAAGDDWAITNGTGTPLANLSVGRTYVFRSLTAGSTTFKLQYRTGGVSGAFLRRTIWAIAA